MQGVSTGFQPEAADESASCCGAPPTVHPGTRVDAKPSTDAAAVLMMSLQQQVSHWFLFESTFTRGCTPSSFTLSLQALIASGCWSSVHMVTKACRLLCDCLESRITFPGCS